jgi:hypothetical protein
MRQAQLVVLAYLRIITMKNALKLSISAVEAAVSAALHKSNFSQQEIQLFKLACQLPPASGLVSINEFHAKNLNLQPGEHQVWFVTKGDPQSVFFDETTGLFGSCWGPDLDNGLYDDLGYRSIDPVEMYLV